MADSDGEREPDTPSTKGKNARTRKPRAKPLVAERRELPDGNVIEGVASRAARERRATPSAEVVSEETPSAGPRASATARRGKLDTETIPPSIQERFTRDGHTYYFPDGHVAFQDRGRRLTANTENTAVIASLLEIAQARQWQTIAVTGSETFRREVWRQARLHDFEVNGYTPTREEQAALIRAKSRDNEAARDGAAVEEGAARAGPDVPADDPVPRGGGRPPPREEIVTGKLLEHGREHYRFDPHAEDWSYFVRLQTAEGPRVVWGLDLQRAIEKSLSQPQVGDEVAMRRTGAEPVTVNRQTRGPEGEVLSETALQTQRYRWRIERTDFFADREELARVLRDPAIKPQRAVQDRPELAGAYLQVHAAELAAGMFKEPRDRVEFVERVRRALADEVARGEPLPQTRLRERTKEPERDVEPPSVHG